MIDSDVQNPVRTGARRNVAKFARIDALRDARRSNAKKEMLNVARKDVGETKAGVNLNASRLRTVGAGKRKVTPMHVISLVPV